MAETITETDEVAAAFAAMGLDPRLVETLTALGYEEPTPIQREAIPPLLEGRDLVGLAATGTGKTAAFALPVLQRMAGGERGGDPMALVLVPTRELAVQVSEALHRYGRDLSARVLPIYGGQPIGRQLRALDAGVDVVVAIGALAAEYLEGAGDAVADGRWAPTLDEGLVAVAEVVRPGDCVLVKGSRSVGLEAVADALAVVAA